MLNQASHWLCQIFTTTYLWVFLVSPWLLVWDKTDEDEAIMTYQCLHNEANALFKFLIDCIAQEFWPPKVDESNYFLVGNNSGGYEHRGSVKKSEDYDLLPFWLPSGLFSVKAGWEFGWLAVVSFFFVVWQSSYFYVRFQIRIVDAHGRCSLRRKKLVGFISFKHGYNPYHSKYVVPTS